MVRNNPAEPDFQIRELLREVQEARSEVARVQADAHSQATPIAGSTESIRVDPTNPHLLIYTSAVTNPSAHVIDIPYSTLLQPDAADPHQMNLPVVGL